MPSGGSAQAADLLAQLRASTSEQHHELDGQLRLGTEAGVDSERYARFLTATAGVLEVLEPAIEAFVPLEGPTRREALRADLKALGVSGPGGAPEASIPRPASLASAFGCAYVLEGSTLGGLGIARTVEASLGSLATRYLRLRGERTAQAFRAFLARLAAFDGGATPDERAEACTAARATFAAYTAAYGAAGLLHRG
jgi:heme oxygenase